MKTLNNITETCKFYDALSLVFERFFEASCRKDNMNSFYFVTLIGRKWDAGLENTEKAIEKKTRSGTFYLGREQFWS